MTRLATFEYPDVRFSRLADVVEKLCHPPYKGEISRENLGEVLGMTPRGGAFYSLLASLKDFGLVEGREQLKVTELGKKVAVGSGSEKEQAKAQAFLNVPLFRVLFDRTGPSMPDEESFSILLKEVTKADPLKVNSQYRDVMSVYADGIRLLDALKKPEMGGNIDSAPDFVFNTKEGLAFIEIKAGQFYQRLPYDNNGFEVAIKFLEGLKEASQK